MTCYREKSRNCPRKWETSLLKPSHNNAKKKSRYTIFGVFFCGWQLRKRKQKRCTWKFLALLILKRLAPPYFQIFLRPCSIVRYGRLNKIKSSDRLIQCNGLKEEYVKFMFLKKATKFDEIFTVDLTLCSKSQIDGEDFVNFYGLLRKCELYCKRETSEIKFANFIEFRAWEYYEFCLTLKSTHLYIYWANVNKIDA